jgi:hypothetical protein
MMMMMMMMMMMRRITIDGRRSIMSVDALQTNKQTNKQTKKKNRGVRTARLTGLLERVADQRQRIFGRLSTQQSHARVSLRLSIE